jgi:hypothetical protein
LSYAKERINQGFPQNFFPYCHEWWWSPSWGAKKLIQWFACKNGTWCQSLQQGWSTSLSLWHVYPFLFPYSARPISLPSCHSFCVLLDLAPAPLFSTRPAHYSVHGVQNSSKRRLTHLTDAPDGCNPFKKFM